MPIPVPMPSYVILSLLRSVVDMLTMTTELMSSRPAECSLLCSRLSRLRRLVRLLGRLLGLRFRPWPPCCRLTTRTPILVPPWCMSATSLLWLTGVRRTSMLMWVCRLARLPISRLDSLGGRSDIYTAWRRHPELRDLTLSRTGPCVLTSYGYMRLPALGPLGRRLNWCLLNWNLLLGWSILVTRCSWRLWLSWAVPYVLTECTRSMRPPYNVPRAVMVVRLLSLWMAMARAPMASAPWSMDLSPFRVRWPQLSWQRLRSLLALFTTMLVRTLCMLCECAQEVTRMPRLVLKSPTSPVYWLTTLTRRDLGSSRQPTLRKRTAVSYCLLFRSVTLPCSTVLQLTSRPMFPGRCAVPPSCVPVSVLVLLLVGVIRGPPPLNTFYSLPTAGPVLAWHGSFGLLSRQILCRAQRCRTHPRHPLGTRFPGSIYFYTVMGRLGGKTRHTVRPGLTFSLSYSLMHFFLYMTVRTMVVRYRS